MNSSKHIQNKEDLILRKIGFSILVLNTIFCIISLGIGAVRMFLSAIEDSRMIAFYFFGAPFFLLGLLMPYIFDFTFLISYHEYKKNNNLIFLFLIIVFAIMGYSITYGLGEDFYQNISTYVFYYIYIIFKIIIIAYMLFYLFVLWARKYIQNMA